MLCDTSPNLVARELNVSKEPAGDTNEGVLWPRREPINSGVVDKTWELAGPLSERVSHGRKAKVQMEVVPHLAQEEVEQLDRVIRDSHRLGLRAHLAADLLDLVLCKELWDVARGKDIVDVDKVLVVDDLGVSEDEYRALTLHASLLE